MKRNADHRKTTGLLTLLVFGIFALCLGVVLLTGANVYRNLTDRDSTTHDHRIAVRYLTTRLRQAQDVTVEDFCGVEALTIREDYDGVTYLTRVYLYDGFIRELFCGETADLSPEDGFEILEAEALSFSRDGNLLTVEITTTDGLSQKLLLTHSTWKEVLP